MLGLFALNNEGISGGVLQMINHGLSTSALFLMIGMIFDRYKTRQLTRLGGLAQRPSVARGLYDLRMLCEYGTSRPEWLRERVSRFKRHVCPQPGLYHCRGRWSGAWRLVLAVDAAERIFWSSERNRKAHRLSPICVPSKDCCYPPS